jgi:Ca-activated chloride channel homolog
MRSAWFSILLVLSSVLAPAAPQAPDLHPTISVETDLVMLPVAVVDNRGAYVAGLTRDHFTVYDNGQPQPIQFFSSEDSPATVGLVIDCSTSMRARRSEVTAAATAFATFRDSLDELFTVNFNEEVWLGLPPSLPFARNVDELHAALAAAPARGKTALYDALTTALDHLQRGSRDRKALIVVSDGGDNASAHTLAQATERARRTGAVVYAVILFDPDDREAKPSVLKRLARETGGQAFTPVQREDVMAAFTQIAREIKSGYTIGFSPPAAPDGGFRSIRVVADSRNHRPLVVRTRAGYYAGRAARDVP